MNNITRKFIKILLRTDLLTVRQIVICREAGYRITTANTHLKEDGTSYMKLLSLVRWHKCKKAMRAGLFISSDEMTEIAGFNNVSTLLYRWKGWTGKPFTQYKHTFVDDASRIKKAENRKRAAIHRDNKKNPPAKPAFKAPQPTMATVPWRKGCKSYGEQIDNREWAR